MHGQAGVQQCGAKTPRLVDSVTSPTSAQLAVCVWCPATLVMCARLTCKIQQRPDCDFSKHAMNQTGTPSPRTPSGDAFTVNLSWWWSGTGCLATAEVISSHGRIPTQNARRVHLVQHTDRAGACLPTCFDRTGVSVLITRSRMRRAASYPRARPTSESRW